MTPEQIDRVFGCGRLQMVTGKHVEVFREAAVAGTRRRYTKRFLHTLEADFGQWTEREWRILARLIGHGIACVPEVARFDRGGPHEPAVVQTYDAGITVDHWATLLPVQRGGRTLRHVFEDCAHWWALARHLLLALDAIHELRLVHLDLKADNVCIEALTNLTIKVGQSYVAIESGGIKIGTTGNVEVEATGNITAKATGNLEMEATATGKVKAGASLAVEASGVTEVKGAVVKIN